MEENPENPRNGDAGTPPPLPPDAAPQFAQPPAPSAPPAGDGPYSFGAEPGQAAGGGEYSSPASAPVNRGSIRAGDVFSRSWNMLAKNPGLYIGLAVIPAVPSFIGDVLGTGLSGSLFQIISSCLGLVLQAAIAYAVYRSMSGDGTTMGEAFNKGMKRFLPVLGASILLGILTGVGYMLLVVPGLIITCVYIVTIPVCAVEHTGAIDSLRRSAILTKGNRWTIFALLATVFVAIFVISMVVVMVFVQIVDSEILLDLLVNLLILVPTAFQSVMTAVIYYMLREVKEGVSVDSLANVFD